MNMKTDRYIPKPMPAQSASRISLALSITMDSKFLAEARENACRGYGAIRAKFLGSTPIPIATTNMSKQNRSIFFIGFC